MKGIPMKRVAAALLVTVACFTPPAATALAVRGVRSCGTWIEQRATKGFDRLATEAWLVGFLSGGALSTNMNVLQGTDNASLFAWIDNYCRANPLNDLGDGAQDLFIELAKKARKQ